MEWLWMGIGLLLGGALAAAVTYVFSDRKHRDATTHARAESALAAGRVDDAHRSVVQLARDLDTVRRELATVQQERAALAATLDVEREQSSRQTEASRVAAAEIERCRQQIGELQQERTALRANLDAERASLIAQREQFDADRAKLNETFAAMSQDALKVNREAFVALAEERFKTLQSDAAGLLEQKKAEMGQLMQPMQQTLDEYRLKLDAIEQARGQAYLDIKQHLAAVTATQLSLSVETRQLVTALRRPQGRGRWGELTLRRLFEMAGMAERVTFHEQVTTDDGRFRPDCIVQLPEGRQVIVDSKCVLDAFLDATSCDDDVQRSAHVQRHADQVRSRVRDLSSKAYWESFGDATDYVVLFLPGEAFLYAAVDLDPTLIEDALHQRVIIASPTTLLGLLRVIEHGWRRQAIEANAQQIKEVGAKLYERVAKLAQHLERLGRAIGTVSGAYNDTVGSMERNVLSAAREMAKLGVPNKNAPVPQLEEVADQTRTLKASAWSALPAPQPETDDAADCVGA